MPRFRQLLLAVVATGTAATLLISVLPTLAFAYRSPAAHVAIETAASVIALLAAYLVLWRYRLRSGLPDLLLVAALATLALTNLGYSAIPALADGSETSFRTWAPAGGRLLGGLLFAAAAFCPSRPVRDPVRRGRQTLLAAAGGLAAVGVVAAVLGDALPPAIESDLSPEGSSRPRIVGNAGVLALQVVATALYAAAAVGYARRATRTGDEFTGWVALAATCGAFARLNYFLFPSLYSEWVYTGDVLRLAFFLFLLVGVVREIGSHQRDVERAATLEERRRIARDLHDGLAQELAYIYREARRVAAGGIDPEGGRQLAASAGRALDESRDAIALLSAPTDESLEVVLARAAEDVARRERVRLRLELAEGVEASYGLRHALTRIVREAVTNAARHGEAREVTVSLGADGGLRLAVRDDGSGFDTTRADGGFGITSMRERAEAVGGALSIRSAPGRGTEVEVSIP